MSWGKGSNRRPKREGTLSVKSGRGEHVLRVDFKATEVDVVFTDKQPPQSSCQPPEPDEIKITIIQVRHRDSTVKITWSCKSRRRIKFVILG